MRLVGRRPGGCCPVFTLYAVVGIVDLHDAPVFRLTVPVRPFTG